MRVQCSPKRRQRISGDNKSWPATAIASGIRPGDDVAGMRFGEALNLLNLVETCT